MIDIDVNTTDPRRETIALRYWALTSAGEFEEEVDAIAADHGLTRGHVLAIARSVSTVTSTVHCCVRCGAPKQFTCRKAFSETPRQATFVCEMCESSSDVQDEATAASRAEKTSRLQIEATEQMGADALDDLDPSSHPENSVSTETLSMAELRKIRRQVRHMRAEFARLQRTVDNVLSTPKERSASRPNQRRSVS